MDIIGLKSIATASLSSFSRDTLPTKLVVNPTVELHQSDSIENTAELSLQGELWMMKLLIEHITGKSIVLSSPLKSAKNNEITNTSMIAVHGQVEGLQANTINSDFIITLEQRKISSEGLSLSLTSEQQGKLVDPLVINLGRDFADLDSARFYFDLNADGQKEWVPQLSRGSAFLALDKNNNQSIDDGSELFGPQSGNGFADLANYDDNGDGQIDKQDAVFSSLKVWRPDGQFLAIAEVGIESVSLFSELDEKMLRNNEGKLLGIAQRTGEFTRSNGQGGTVQHIDMVI